jgi:hypothetical protein
MSVRRTTSRTVFSEPATCEQTNAHQKIVNKQTTTTKKKKTFAGHCLVSPHVLETIYYLLFDVEDLKILGNANELVREEMAKECCLTHTVSVAQIKTRTHLLGFLS